MDKELKMDIKKTIEAYIDMARELYKSPRKKWVEQYGEESGNEQFDLLQKHISEGINMDLYLTESEVFLKLVSMEQDWDSAWDFAMQSETLLVVEDLDDIEYAYDRYEYMESLEEIA
jgi:hypothetical protein